jgi:hypothetical protein
MIFCPTLQVDPLPTQSWDTVSERANFLALEHPGHAMIIMSSVDVRRQAVTVEQIKVVRSDRQIERQAA